MRKTSEYKAKATSVLGLLVCLGAIPLLYGVTGCSTAKGTGDTGGRTGTGPRSTRLSDAPRPVEPVVHAFFGGAAPISLVGPRGAQGSTTVGIAGAVGREGEPGLQGEVGAIGAEGGTRAGVAGAPGVAGEVGSQGAVGPIGEKGSSGLVSFWTLYREFQFDPERSDLGPAGAQNISEIALYLEQNPTLKVAIDGSMDPRGNDPRNQGLSDERVAAIRTALLKAGVPDSKIQQGAFGDTELTRDRRVVWLVRTDN